jgi:8-oxo-dGTP diphosphatase
MPKEVEVLKYHYPFPMASHTVDAVVFGLDVGNKSLKVLLIERGHEGQPFYGCWALPGGFVNVDTDATLLDAILRELKEETDSTPRYLEQLATFGDKDRDPRGRVISTAFLTLVCPEDLTVKAGDDAAKAQWFDIRDLDLWFRPLHARPGAKQPVKLAFDHAAIIMAGLNRLRSKLRWQPIGFDLLPEQFTLPDLQRVYEAILGVTLDKRNFRAKVMKFGVLVETSKTDKTRSGRPARLYRFDRKKYDRMQRAGLAFEV